MLNHALREVLGENTDQKGSLVAPDRLRFDFSCPKAMTSDQLFRAEKITNEMISGNHPVYYQTVPLDAAMKIKGLRAMFGETYPDPVRVVSVGQVINELLTEGNEAGIKTSVEFCGGTHLHNSGHAKKLIITSEEAISKGIRRIIALTGDEALKAEKLAAKLQSEFDLMKSEIETGCSTPSRESMNNFARTIAEFTKKINDSSIGSVSKSNLRDANTKLKKLVDTEIKKINTAKEAAAIKLVEAAVENLNPEESKFVILRVDDALANGKVLTNCLNKFKKHKNGSNTPIMLISCDEANSKVACQSQVPKHLTEKIKANLWCGEISKLINGKGGGKDVQAMASGSNTENIDEVLSLAEQFAQAKLN